MGNRGRYGTRCIQVFQDIGIKIGSLMQTGFKGQKSHSNPMPMPVAVQDMSCHIICF